MAYKGYVITIIELRKLMPQYSASHLYGMLSDVRRAFELKKQKPVPLKAFCEYMGWVEENIRESL